MPNILRRVIHTRKTIVTFNPGILPKKRNKRNKIKKFIKTNKIINHVKLIIPFEEIEPCIQMQVFFSGQTIARRYSNIMKLKSGIDLLNSKNVLDYNYSLVQNNIKILENYISKEQNIKTIFRRFVQLWLYSKYKNRILNTEDPATLCKPVKSIYIYDAKIKGIYTFEASTLRKSIENSLTFTDWMFPEPIKPKNLFTNISFSDAQMYEIIKQLRRHDMTSWWIEAYMHLNLDIQEFASQHLIPIKLNYLNTMFRNKKGEEYTEYMSDFIDRYYNIHEINNISQLIIIKWAIRTLFDDPYIQKWSDLMYEFMKIRILNNISDSDNDNPLYDSIYTSTYIHFLKYSEISRLGRIRLLSIAKNRRRELISPE